MGMLATYLLDSANRSRAQDYAAQQYGADSPMAQYAAAFPSEFAAVEAQKYQKQAEGSAIAQFYGGGQKQATSIPVEQPQGIQQGVPQDADMALQAVAQGAGVDNSGITWNGPRQQPQQQAQPDNSARYQAMAYLPSALQSVAAQQMMMEGVGGPNASGDGPLTLEDLNPNIAPTIKSMLEGRSDPSLMKRNAQTPMLLQIANRIDPNFDQTTWAARNQAVKDLSPGGKDRLKINSSEALLNHLAELQDSNKKLGGTWLLNGVWNAINAPFNPALKDYQVNQKTAGDEYASVLAGVNGSTEAGREDSEGLFTPNQSPELRKTAIMKAAQLAMEKVEPIASSYNAALGKAQRPIELMSPKAQASYAKLFGDNNTLAGPQGQYTPEPRGSSIQQAASPLGHLSDDEIKKIAKQRGIPTQ